MMLFLFESTHAVMKAERICIKNDVYYKIVPVPRSISSQCGMALEVKKESEDILSKLLEENKLNFEKYFNYKK
ncbi:MAG: DUF3343 domain-containing protein [Bacteroidales bacterium]|nr:DUF3343 domain-containing protein [Bacteroidales bacterium]